jgi:hypothetical protein
MACITTQAISLRSAAAHSNDRWSVDVVVPHRERRRRHRSQELLPLGEHGERRDLLEAVTGAQSTSKATPPFCASSNHVSYHAATNGQTDTVTVDVWDGSNCDKGEASSTPAPVAPSRRPLP